MSNLAENPQGSGKKPNPKALTPILVFLILYLGTGIYFEYIHPVSYTHLTLPTILLV